MPMWCEPDFMRDDKRVVDDVCKDISRWYANGSVNNSRQIKSSFTQKKETVADIFKASDSVTFWLDNSKKMRFEVAKDGVFSAKFTAIPDVETIRNALARDGFAFEEIQSGLTLESKNSICGSIINSATEIKPVETKPVINCSVKNYRGNDVTKILNSYGIDDKMKVFNNIDVVRIQ